MVERILGQLVELVLAGVKEKREAQKLNAFLDDLGVVSRVQNVAV